MIQSDCVLNIQKEMDSLKMDGLLDYMDIMMIYNLLEHGIIINQNFFTILGKKVTK